MGKASRRKALPRTRPAAPPTGRWIDKLAQPVDPQILSMMLDVYEAAATMAMPTTNPEQVSVEFQDQRISFTDTPANRGMLEVTRQLKEIGVPYPQAYTARVICFGEILEAADRFGSLIQRDGPDGFSIDEAVHEACAASCLVSTEALFGYDIDDVIEKAHAIKASRERQDTSAP